MNMKDLEELSEQMIKIPVDMVTDVFAIILKERIKHEVIGVLENRKTLVVAISIDKKSNRHQKALQNILNQLADYEEYRWSENEEINWREG